MTASNTPPQTTLILGGARSGKSRVAEQQVLATGLTPFYLATGRALDEEMRERIDKHRERRGKAWETVEEPLALADAVLQTALPGRVLLVDCLTLWVTNLMMADADVLRECESLIAALDSIRAPVFFVSNEVGLGIVPEDAMARQFRDLAGTVNQQMARRCEMVWFVAAGLPLKLKPQA
ncbi:bifunctional adenosylcobinamide kinase/adenosylcobinamide-phosphate guanylyltransferase [Salaquimonas pukyongi]|uniref:bifunctional adenosylcobinamide kinase/adenosylcobinamide-phosphate guanylyltransferase n=1 Tax=Salaquimonas pukyongi TaxID=2712698 RepID=UPI00096B8319|nr:bifunctional adenosylcobinamide kinase/adenosylcobinamide-phosphate guanylyltransferase [Salaquimonas pukyongi]